MTIRKNKKRIDPRYFLHETTYRDLNEAEDQEIADIATALSKSTAVQEIIAQLSNDSAVASAAQDTLEEVPEAPIEEGDFAANVGAAAAKAGVGVAGISALAATAPASSVFATELMPLLAASAPLQALGIGGGVALAAVGILLLIKHAAENRPG